MHIQPVYPAAIANGHVKEGIFLTISKVHSEQDARFPIHIFLIYVIFYAGHAFYNTYNTLFLYENGLTQEQIGFINSIFTAILIFIKPMWGVISDRSKNKARIIGVLLIANALVCVAFYISASAYWLALCVILYQFFFQPAYTLQESYTLELMDKSRWDYGNIRLGGTLGYAVCAMFTGVLIGDDYGKIYWMMALLVRRRRCPAVVYQTDSGPAEEKRKNSLPPGIFPRPFDLYHLFPAVLLSWLLFQHVLFHLLPPRIGGAVRALGLDDNDRRYKRAAVFLVCRPDRAENRDTLVFGHCNQLHYLKNGLLVLRYEPLSRTCAASTERYVRRQQLLLYYQIYQRYGSRTDEDHSTDDKRNYNHDFLYCHLCAYRRLA